MNPWEIKTDDTRKVDSKKLFIIFCEDGAVEPAYFSTFNSSTVQVNTIGDQKQHISQIVNAAEYFRKNGGLEVNALGKEVIKFDEGTQVWCVFDRDKNPNDGKDAAFDFAINQAKDVGIKTAWSNDDFELWVLLHFEDIDANNPEYMNRTKYYERLTLILKELYPEESLFQNIRFDYYSSMKSKKNFLTYTYQLMKANLKAAIERAEQLEQFHLTTTPKPPHQHCPCTKVHLLVKELIQKEKDL